jgi:hypothetical protein
MHSHFLSFYITHPNYHYRYRRIYKQTMFFSDDLLSSKKGSYVILHQKRKVVVADLISLPSLKLGSVLSGMSAMRPL